MGEPNDTQFPAPHLQFDGFLDEVSVQRLIDFVAQNEPEMAASGVLAAPGDEEEDIRRSRILFELEDIWPMFEAQLVGLLPTIRSELEVHWFPLDHVERQLTVHHDGDFFAVHNDSGGPEVDSRIVTYVYYFNVEPKQFEGGELWMYDYWDDEFYRHRGDEHIELEPRHNSIVFFPSWVHHEVRPVRSKVDGIAGCRMTVNGWFHTVPGDDQPPEDESVSEAAPDDTERPDESAVAATDG